LTDIVTEDARLWTLRELQKQVDGRLNEILIRGILDKKYGINRDRDWVVTQLRKLEMLGVIELIPTGTVLVAKITALGRDFLDERVVVEGITLPSEAR
jgi:hypothetical protein